MIASGSLLGAGEAQAVSIFTCDPNSWSSAPGSNPHRVYRYQYSQEFWELLPRRVTKKVRRFYSLTTTYNLGGQTSVVTTQVSCVKDL